MDIYKVKWTRLQAEIFRFLCTMAGQSMNLREISRALKVSPTAISNSLPDLEKGGILKITKSKTMNLLSIGFNRDNRKAIEFKRTENLRLIYESGLSDFLHNEFPGCTIILFGSYSRGDDVWFGENDERNSDIDIAVVGAKERKIDLLRFDKTLSRTITINFYKSWADIHKHLRNNILNGIILCGAIEL